MEDDTIVDASWQSWHFSTLKFAEKRNGCVLVVIVDECLKEMVRAYFTQNCRQQLIAAV